MTSDALEFYQGFIPQIWSFFVSWHIPGTFITPAQLGFFLLALPLIFRTLKRLASVSDASFGSSKPGSKSFEG